MNVYLFCYAPLTQAAVEMLVCVPTCSECVKVLSIDYGISCSSGEYYAGAAVALGTLACFTVAVPLLLVLVAKKAVVARDSAIPTPWPVSSALL